MSPAGLPQALDNRLCTARLETIVGGGHDQTKAGRMDTGRMRLTCSDCNAQYEVDDGAIPGVGREVECSSCGHSWFQKGASSDFADDDGDQHPNEAAEGLPSASKRESASVEEVGAGMEGASISTPSAQPPRVGDLGADVPSHGLRRQEADGKAFDVLRQEAAREIDARRREGAMAAGGGPLPDSEKIASSLRSMAVRDDPARNRIRFRIGFALMLLTFALGVAIYEMAPQIVASVPPTEQALGTYVDAVNRARAGLDAAWMPIREAVSGLLEGV